MKDMFGIVNMQNQMLIESAKQEVRACNAMSEKFGLSLNEDEIRELVACRADALKKTGRIEFAGGILPKLIYAFCDSPYIQQENYECTLAELQEAFYGRIITSDFILSNPTYREFLKDVDSADYWNDFEVEEWESACEFAGLNYRSYDDPDFLFNDVKHFII